MGHLIFVVLHFIALLFGAMLLLVTIPLHLIYGVAGGRRGPAPPNRWTHVKCPWCFELVFKKASICPHCRQGLVPQ
jgi:hypothetical protein